MALRLLPLIFEAATRKAVQSPAALCSSRAAVIRASLLAESSRIGVLGCCATFSSSGSHPDGVDKMLDIIASNPHLQQMLMSAMPKHMQRPEVLKGILENPAVRKKVAEMVAQQGMGMPPGMLDMMDHQRLSQTLQQSKSMGLDPSVMFQKLLAQPGLMQKFQDPRIVKAFLEIAQDPKNLTKYEHDREIVEVYFAAKDILLPSMTHEGQGSVSPESASTGSAHQARATVTVLPPQVNSSEAASSKADTIDASFEPSSGPGPTSHSAKLQDASMQQLMSDPERLARLAKAGANPRVQKALAEIAQSRWKLVRYMFDKEVMAALKDLGEVAKEAGERQSRTE